jgi:hypothetical protein
MLGTAATGGGSFWFYDFFFAGRRWVSMRVSESVRFCPVLGRIFRYRPRARATLSQFSGADACLATRREAGSVGLPIAGGNYRDST